MGAGGLARPTSNGMGANLGTQKLGERVRRERHVRNGSWRISATNTELRRARARSLPRNPTIFGWRNVVQNSTSLKHALANRAKSFGSPEKKTFGEITLIATSSEVVAPPPRSLCSNRAPLQTIEEAPRPICWSNSRLEKSM